MAQRKKNAKKQVKKNPKKNKKKKVTKTVKKNNQNSNTKVNKNTKTSPKNKRDNQKKKSTTKTVPKKKNTTTKATNNKKIPTPNKNIESSKEKKQIDLLSKIKESKICNLKHYHRLKIASITCLILAILLFIPYGISYYKSEASGKTLEVPKFLMLKEECCSYSAMFSTIRSAWSLKHDLEKIISNYQVLDCDDKIYYYNPVEDYTITEYGVNKGIIFNEVYITYGKGNSCDIDTTFKSLELLADDFSIEDAKRDGNYVIDGDKVYNASAYDEFLENVEAKIPSTLRIVTTTTDGDVVITDLAYLSDGKYKVTYDGTRDRNNKDNRSIIAYKYEKLGIYKNKLYAYNGSKITSSLLKTEDAYYLFTISE